STSSPAPTPTPTQTSTAPATAPSGLSSSSHVLMNFAWSSVTGAKGYEFELETSTGSVVDDQTLTSPHISNVEVTKDTKCCGRVRAPGGNWSAWKSFTSPCPDPLSGKRPATPIGDGRPLLHPRARSTVRPGGVSREIFPPAVPLRGAERLLPRP